MAVTHIIGHIAADKHSIRLMLHQWLIVVPAVAQVRTVAEVDLTRQRQGAILGSNPRRLVWLCVLLQLNTQSIICHQQTRATKAEFHSHVKKLIALLLCESVTSSYSSSFWHAPLGVHRHQPPQRTSHSTNNESLQKKIFSCNESEQNREIRTNNKTWTLSIGCDVNKASSVKANSVTEGLNIM